MNRDLKFRVWDSELKTYNTPCVHHLEKQDGVMVSKLNLDIVKVCGADRFVIEMCTGLPDKNGKMIFEGDILRQNDLRFEIRFESFQWVAVCPYYNKYHHPRIEHFRLCANGEVIGNIMENPELLKA
jgi:uncharacterized phage protein (TIGR01671 family)